MKSFYLLMIITVLVLAGLLWFALTGRRTVCEVEKMVPGKCTSWNAFGYGVTSDCNIASCQKFRCEFRENKGENWRTVPCK